MLSLGRAQAVKLLQWQALACVATALMWLLSSSLAAVSAGAGGLICLIGNAIFVYFALRHGSARKASQIVSSLFLGELLKMLLIVILFAAVFLYTGLQPLPLMTGFLFTQAVFWMAPLLFKRMIQANNHD